MKTIIILTACVVILISLIVWIRNNNKFIKHHKTFISKKSKEWNNFVDAAEKEHPECIGTFKRLRT